MNSYFRFFGKGDDPALEAEFSASYQAPSAPYLVHAMGFAAGTALSFYLLARASGANAHEPAQIVRLLVALFFIVATAAFYFSPSLATKRYSLVLNTVSIVGIGAGSYASFIGHESEGLLPLAWNLDMTTVITIVIIFGFSRLQVLNTLLLVLIADVTSLLYLLIGGQGGDKVEIWRVALHLSLCTFVLFVMRRGLEMRERKLFLMAKENLEHNVYAKQLEKAMHAADAANEAKTRFLANMSHEIRTPLSGVIQILDVVSKEASGENLQLIRKGRIAGEALLRILKGILEYAKLEHGAALVSTTTVSLPEVCQTVIDLHLPAAAAKGIVLYHRLDLAPSLRTIETDEVKLFEIVNNLVSNAIKFTQVGVVEVGIRVALRNDSPFPNANLLIEVRDSGVGIPVARQGDVFLPFVQIDAASTRRSGGTGLGLSIVRELIGLMGGQINMASMEGVGTRCTVTLPVRVSDADVQASGVPRLDPSQSAGAANPAISELVSRFPLTLERAPLSGRVLVAEDNELIAMLTSRTLGQFGLDVVVAENGQIAFDQFKQRGFDIVLMDCQMPVMDGYEATRLIRKREAEEGMSGIPILALTANSLKGDRQICLDCGMSDFLQKPCSEAELYHLLQMWMGKHSTPQTIDYVHALFE